MEHNRCHSLQHTTVRMVRWSWSAFNNAYREMVTYWQAHTATTSVNNIEHVCGSWNSARRVT